MRRMIAEGRMADTYVNEKTDLVLGTALGASRFMVEQFARGATHSTPFDESEGTLGRGMGNSPGHAYSINQIMNSVGSSIRSIPNDVANGLRSTWEDLKGAKLW